MIESIHFQNFKALRAATLPLAPFTLIVGPNGSGKSTAMEGLRFLWDPSAYRYERVVTAGWEREADASIEVVIKCLDAGTSARVISGLDFKGSFGPVQEGETQLRESIKKRLANFRVFHFDPNALARPVQTQQKTELGADGSNLAAVLNALSGREPERFEALNKELKRWLPEFDRVVFDFPGPGQVEFLLRTRLNHHRYRASDLSHGTIFALAYLTLAYLPEPPAIIGFEEPDQGIHPRLLSEIREGMYRLAYPQDFGETRESVQVIATTHSPYLLDLYKEHPEQIVIAHKDENGVHFERLSEKDHISELLDGAPLGDIWFSGILGGVPATHEDSRSQ